MVPARGSAATAAGARGAYFRVQFPSRNDHGAIRVMTYGAGGKTVFVTGNSGRGTARWRGRRPSIIEDGPAGRAGCAESALPFAPGGPDAAGRKPGGRYTEPVR